MPLQHSPKTRRSPRNHPIAASLQVKQKVTVSTTPNSDMQSGEREELNGVHMPPGPCTSSSTAGTSSTSATAAAVINWADMPPGPITSSSTAGTSSTSTTAAAVINWADMPPGPTTSSFTAGTSSAYTTANMPPGPTTSSSTAGTPSASTTVAAAANMSVSDACTIFLNPAAMFEAANMPQPITPAPYMSADQPSNVSQPDMETLHQQIHNLQAQLMHTQQALKAATTKNANMAPPSSTTGNIINSSANNNSSNNGDNRRDPPPFFFVGMESSMSPGHPSHQQPITTQPSAASYSTQQQHMAAQSLSAQPTAASYPLHQQYIAAHSLNAQPITTSYTGPQQLLAAQLPNTQSPASSYPMQPLRKIFDLPQFSGAAEDWPMFLSAFDHTTAAYGYNNFENCLRLQKALKGEALECVKSLLIHPNNMPTAMEQLKFQYGRPELLIRCQLQQVKEFSPIAENAIERLVPFAIKVRNLAAFLETANGQQHLSNPTLMDELVQKLPMSRRLDWAQYASSLRPWPTILDFSNWLQGVANLIRSIQPTSASVSVNNSGSKKKVVLYATDTQQNSAQCPCCRGQHKIAVCKKFLEKSASVRWSEVKNLRLCFSCLSAGHASRDCRRRKECQVNGCRRKHNKLLHEDQPNTTNGNTTSNTASSNSGPTAEPVLSCVSNIGQKGELLFRVLPVKLYGPNSVVNTYALLDEGSSVTMIDSSLVRQLGLEGRKNNLNLCWYGGKSSQEAATVVDVYVSGANKTRKYAMKGVYGVSNLKLPCQSFNSDVLKEHGIPITPYNNVAPKMLIGLDHCHLGLPDEIVPLEEGGPFAVNTPLGWLVFGKVNDGHPTASTCLLTTHPDNLHELVANYFEVENFGVKALPAIESHDDLRAKRMLDEFTKRVDGRFTSRLLWRQDNVVLPDSYSMALNRLHSMERKIKRNAEFGFAYKNIIADYIKKGYVRKLEETEAHSSDPRTWYLPHFGVVNPNKPGKIRLVFDAAAKVEGVSLNSKLLKGPQKYKPLLSVLFNFRIGAIAVTGDIREMFHQIIVAAEDRCSQRFLWRENENCQPDVYEMVVMTFGAACSPCVAQYVKEKNALEFRDRFPRAVESILDRHYVDDFVDSFEDVPKAIEIANQVRQIHRAAGFELRNFTSNSPDVVAALKGNIEHQVEFSSDLNQFVSSAEKILGMFWQPGDDAFKFVCSFHRVKDEIISGQRCPTKRELLSVVMSVFDPIGFLCLFMINAKLLLREIWRCNTRWDEKIPDRLEIIWNNWRQQLKNVSHVHVPRFYFGLGLPDILEIHVFVDASEDAFGAVAYWRYISAGGKIGVSFISAKSKCAPLKTMTIPRLELQAAVLGTRLLCTIVEEHSLKVARCICWSDSTTVIKWIGAESRRYKPFVAHRIAEILDSTRPADWRWLPTDLNVADEITRIKNDVDFSFETRWFQGPQFLYGPEDDWPTTTTTRDDECCLEELRPKFNLLVCKNSIIDFNRFSSFLRLKRTIAWALRFVDRCRRKKHDGVTKSLTADEIHQAELHLCRLAQNESYQEEIRILRSGGKLDKTNELYTLSPYLDENNCLRVYGRIDAASWLPLDSRRPIILSPNHQLSTLIVAHEHNRMKHQNFEATLGQIRRKFWVPRLRRALAKCISNCNSCKTRRVTPVPPYMGPLPVDRLTPYVRPFTYTGVDYFGPVNITIGRRQEKRWVALFTCLTVRAVHLEVAFDLSTDACILAIRNFINRRGTPLKMRSDNGKNFVGVDQEAKRFEEVFDTVRIQDELSSKGITWEFNCPHNPAEGGIWERMVQCVKKVLRVTLKEVAPREHTLQSFLIEAENIVNSRPLTHLPVSHDDEEPLTPNHFLLGEPNTAQTPEGTIIDKPVALRKQWRIARQLRDHFWKRWITEYLPTLTRRSKWCEQTKPVAPGDLVLICDPAVSRREWRRGRVEKVHRGSDGVVRRADVRTSTGVLMRPISKLAVLDIVK